MFDKLSWSIYPKQYQDIKARLWWYILIILIIAGVLFYRFILSNEHRQAINTLFGNIASFQIVGFGFIAIVSLLFSWFFIFFLEIYNIYDRFITKWRFYYDTDFIIPNLVRPFTNKLDKSFFRLAQDEKNKDDFMKIFYHFVADYEHDHKIRENLIVRFYEVITKYWITQINEILVFLFFLLTFFYYFICSVKKIPISIAAIANTNFIIAIFFVINRLLIRYTSKSVRNTTRDEIEDIHDRYLNELKQELKKLHEKFNLKYNED